MGMSLGIGLVGGPSSSSSTDPSQYVDVTEFGGVGDGVTNNGPAIAAAIAAAVASGKRQIHFPACAVSYVVNLSGVANGAAAATIPSNFRVTGSGRASPIKISGIVGTAGTEDKYVFRMAASTANVEIQDLYFFGENSPYSFAVTTNQSAAIAAAGGVGTEVVNINISGCEFENLFGFSVTVTNGLRCSFNRNRVHQVANFTRITGEYCTTADNIITESNALTNTGGGWVCSENRISKSNLHSIIAGGDSTLRLGSSISYNQIEESGGYGIWVQNNLAGSALSGNRIRKTTDHGIQADGATVRNLRISGNQLSAIGLTAGPKTGIRVTGAGGHIIAGNDVRDLGDAGYALNACVDVSTAAASDPVLIFGNYFKSTNLDLFTGGNAVVHLGANVYKGPSAQGFTGGAVVRELATSAQPVSATGPVGTVVRKIEVFNAAGTSLGFIPVYNAIT